MLDYEQAAARVLEAFQALLRRDAGLARLNARIDKGLATYADAERLASITGREIGQLIRNELTALFPSGQVPREAAEAILPPALRRNYDIVSKAAERVQKALNDRAGIGLAPVRPRHRQERDDNLVTYVTSQEDFASGAKRFPQLTENNSMQIVDDAVRENADLHYNAGLSPKIERRMSGRACAFCRERAGVFDYSVNMDKEVFRRHTNCQCTVEYNPGSGSRRRQNVHTKKWRDETEGEQLHALTESADGKTSAEEIEQRKQIGEKRFRGVDVTAEYFGTATPGKGTYKQDDNVEEEDVRMAKTLFQTFGGDIHVKERIDNIKDYKNPDYEWRGKLWDLKTTHTDKAVLSAVKGGLKQIKKNPGGLVIDMLGSDRHIEKTIEHLESRIRQGQVNNLDVILYREGKVVTILRYNK